MKKTIRCHRCRWLWQRRCKSLDYRWYCCQWCQATTNCCHMSTSFSYSAFRSSRMRRHYNIIWFDGALIYLFWWEVNNPICCQWWKPISINFDLIGCDCFFFVFVLSLQDSHLHTFPLDRCRIVKLLSPHSLPAANKRRRFFLIHRSLWPVIIDSTSNRWRSLLDPSVSGNIGKMSSKDRRVSIIYLFERCRLLSG